MYDKFGNSMDVGNYVKHQEFGYGKIIYELQTPTGWNIMCEEWDDEWVSSSVVGLINNDAVFKYIGTKLGYSNFIEANYMMVYSKSIEVNIGEVLEIELFHKFDNISISCLQDPKQATDFIMSKDIPMGDNLESAPHNIEYIIEKFEKVCKQIYYLSQAI